MIGDIIPAHNEADLLGSCLASVLAASQHNDLEDEGVQILVVLDSCTDGTELVADRAGVNTLRIDACNVGIARAAGAEQLLAQGARWLAFTDADSRVASDWLVRQLVLGADVVCGSVQVDDWESHPVGLRRVWNDPYRDTDGHRHVHGANLGVSARAYQSVGGFRPLACGEDVALVNALTEAGFPVAWSAAPRVATSARRHARARGGFGDTLANWARELTIALDAPSGPNSFLVRKTNASDILPCVPQS